MTPGAGLAKANGGRRLAPFFRVRAPAQGALSPDGTVDASCVQEPPRVSTRCDLELTSADPNTRYVTAVCGSAEFRVAHHQLRWKNRCGGIQGIRMTANCPGLQTSVAPQGYPETGKGSGRCVQHRAMQATASRVFYRPEGTGHNNTYRFGLIRVVPTFEPLLRDAW